MVRPIIKISIISWVVYAAFLIGRMNYAAILPVIRETYGFSNSELGLIASAMFLAYTLSQIPSGVLVDRLGIKYVLFIGCLFISLGNMLMVSWIFSMMILGQFINGAGQSTGWASLIKYSSRSKERAKAIGVLGSSVPAGTFLSYVFAGSVAQELGLNFAFIIPASIILLVGIASLIGFPRGEKSSFNFEFFKSKNVVILAMIHFSILFAMFGLYTWLPTFFFDVYGLNEFNAAKFASIIPLAGIIGGISGGVFSDRVGEKKTIMFNQVLASSLFLLVTAFLLAGSFWLVYVTLFIASVFFRFSVGAVFSVAVKTVGEHQTGTISGFITFVANIGSVISTGLIGLIIDFVGFEYVFITIAILFASTFLISLKLKE